MEQENSYFEQLLRAGLRISPSRSYRGKKGDFGWTRMRFSLTEEKIRDAVAKLEVIFEGQKSAA